MKNELNNLQTIPGVGPNLARDFFDIGIKSVADLKGKDPEKMYLQICAHQGTQVDRCVLYVCRCAVYFANNTKHDFEKLKWWNWKDDKIKRIKN